MTTAHDTRHTRRLVTVRGVVQGVGFRPYVYALASELGLVGEVSNNSAGVRAEVEGEATAVAEFCARIGPEAPPLAVVEAVRHETIPERGDAGFTIADSSAAPGRTLVSPDVATCAQCLADLRDPANRRYRHPFVTCTHCGPRFTIVTALPYDRANTTMAGFPMCPRCAGEYTDPTDRRFHAQPIACHECGPRLRLLFPPAQQEPNPLPHQEDREQDRQEHGEQALETARRLLARGAILAVKGIGGYHLACDATDAQAVARLRARKQRGDKPFGVMAADLDTARRLTHLDATERELLTSPRSPIVLARRREAAADHTAPIAEAVAPDSPDLGVLLPYTPLHHLLFGLPGDPPGPQVLVMTSGNLAGEPLVTDDGAALDRLAALADAWLTHDRPIQVPCDDSVSRVVHGEEQPLRRSRGYAPLPVTLPLSVPATLAVGGDLKNTCCLAEDRRAWLSAHLGDLDDLRTLTSLPLVNEHLAELTGVRPRVLAADQHPGYRSGLWARDNADQRPLHRVQHHHAHLASAMAEAGLPPDETVIGIAFDGTGYGDDGAVWGGEALLASYDGYTRFAHLGYVPLPGGDAAVHNPCRTALSHLRAAGVGWDGTHWDPDLPCVAACTTTERRLLARQFDTALNCLPTSSMGRLFDAVASLLGMRHRVDYEAQAAMALEAAAVAAGDVPASPRYCFTLRDPASGPALAAAGPDAAGSSGPLVADPAPVLAALVADLRAGEPPGRLAARFHHAVVRLVREICRTARERTGLTSVALSGGVFANTLLSAECARTLRQDGHTVLRHRQVPPNDGGLALGQVVVAARAHARQEAVRTTETGRAPGPPPDTEKRR